MNTIVTRNNVLSGCALFLVVIGFALWVASYNIADGDLWARLAVGAAFWNTGTLWGHDVFAFTPTLPQWIDHEWGAGVIFFAVLKLFGPAGLLGLKVILAVLALCIPLYVAHRQGVSVGALLLIALPVAWAIVPGYIPVIRSHALTYVLFGVTLLIAQMGCDRAYWLWSLPAIMLFWANVHGGFVTGFAILMCFGVMFWDERRPKRWRITSVIVLLCCIGVTLVNPYGLDYWSYLASALSHPRPRITEWAPMPLWGWDAFTGFRVLFLLVVLTLFAWWRLTDARIRLRMWPGLLLVVVTALAAWQHRRHAPFFAISVCAVLPLYLDAVAGAISTRFDSCTCYLRTVKRWGGVVTLGGAVWVIMVLLVSVSGEVLAPVGLFPVRECDVLARAGIAGNAIVPFDWGSYVAWRLYPKVKVSMDGRYEETFPEDTFELNERFYNKEGTNWAALVHGHDVNFIIVDRRRTNLADVDLVDLGFERVWTSTLSDLWARQSAAESLRVASATLPDFTIQPLDAEIANKWPCFSRKKP